jgi:hypothetical protein
MEYNRKALIGSGIDDGDVFVNVVASFWDYVEAQSKYGYTEGISTPPIRDTSLT